MDGDFNLDTTNREAIVGSVTPSGCKTHLLGGSKWRSPRPGLTEHLLPGPSVFTAALPGSTSKGPSCSLSPLLRRSAVKAAGRGRLLPELSVFTDALSGSASVGSTCSHSSLLVRHCWLGSFLLCCSAQRDRRWTATSPGSGSSARASKTVSPTARAACTSKLLAQNPDLPLHGSQRH